VLDASALDEKLTSLDDSSSIEPRIRQLQDEIADLLDRATQGNFLERTLQLIRCRQLVDQLNQLLGHDTNSPQLRTLEQAHRDLASGKLR